MRFCRETDTAKCLTTVGWDFSFHPIQHPPLPIPACPASHTGNCTKESALVVLRCDLETTTSWNACMQAPAGLSSVLDWEVEWMHTCRVEGPHRLIRHEEMSMFWLRAFGQDEKITWETFWSTLWSSQTSRVSKYGSRAQKMACCSEWVSTSTRLSPSSSS